jgi:hypothetical protein
MAKQSKTRTIYRSAITGRIVTKDYAEKNPNTTIKQVIKLNT